MKKSAIKNRIKSYWGKHKTTIFVVALSLQLAIGLTIYFLFGRISPNDEIFVPKEGSVAFLMNENPRFSVDFGKVKEPDKQWVRFEAQTSSKNPFEEERGNIFTKIAKLFQKKERYGIEMSLVGVDLKGEDLKKYGDEVILVADVIGTDSVKTSTELIDVGREIGVYEDQEVPVSKQTVLNKDVADGVDLEYQILKGLGLKEEIIIRDLEAYKDSCKEKGCSLPVNEFVFELKMDSDVELREGWFTVDGQSRGTYYFVDSKGRYIAHFLPNFAIDNINNKTFDVNLKVEKGEDDNYRAKVTVNLKWLLSSERVFPVRIDPSIVHDDTSDFSGGVFNGAESATGPKIQIPPSTSVFDCTGGTVTTDGDYRIHTFTASGTLVCTGSGNAAVLVVAGGGGGAGGALVHGGGGAGGMVYNASVAVPSGNSSVTVGNGGTAGSGGTAGGTGGDSVFSTITAYGGGGGVVPTNNGLAGGNGGGGAGWNGAAVSGGTASQGYDGGGVTVGDYAGGGGGGAGAVGGTGIDWTAGNGGAGASSSISGTATYYAGGGGGSGRGGLHGVGGIGGGGNGGSSAGTNGLGGGGGGGAQSAVGYAGGSGVVIVRYIPTRDNVRIFGEYTSSSMDMGASYSEGTLSWAESGVNTGNGETPYSTVNMVAQWNLNETSGTTAVSGGSCGTSCNGTLTNFASTGSQDAAAGTGWTANNKRWGAGAVMFDGTNDYITTASLGFDYDTITISAWVNPKILTSRHTIVDLGTETTLVPQLEIGVCNAGTNAVCVITPGVWQAQTGNNVISTDTWNHIVYTKSGTGATHKIYVNGVEQTLTLNASATYASTAASKKVGSRAGTSQYFNGTLDSLSLYSRALSADEILSNYQAGNIEFQYRVSADNSTWSSWTSPNDTEVPFYESTTYYFDGSTSISDPGGIWTNDSNAFDGSTIDVSSADESGNISTKTSNYLEGVGTTAPTSGENIVSVEARSNAITAFGSAMYATYYDGTTELGTSSGGDQNDYSGYVTLTEPSGGWTWTKIDQLKVRFHSNGTDTSGEMGSSVGAAQIKVTHHQASFIEIEQGRIEADASTVGLWHLDERDGSGAYIKDSTANASDGTPTGTTYSNSGKIGGARNFNGTSDVISVPDSDSWRLDSGSNANSWTVSFWVMFNGDPGTGRDGFIGQYVDVSNLWGLYYLNYQFLIRVRAAGSDVVSASINWTPVGSTWYNIVVVKNGTSFILYVNGIQQGSTLVSTGVGSNLNAPLTIGRTRNNSGVYAYMNGLMDEVYVAKRAWSASEVASSYRLGRDTYINTEIETSDLSSSSTLSMSVAGDRPGPYLNTIWGETGSSNYQPDVNTVGLWHLDGTQMGDLYEDSSGYQQDGVKTYYGMKYGIQSSNLTLIMNQWNGAANTYEMDITCTGGDSACQIVTLEGETLFPTNIAYGVAGQESASNLFIMYSPSLSGQGITRYTNNSNNFIAVRYSGGWQYDNNTSWVAFTPRNENIIVASSVWGTSATMLDFGPVSTAGKIGGAMEFDGINDYITTGANYNIAESPFTISFWINPTSLANDPIPLSNGGYQTGGIYLQINNAGQIIFFTNQSGAIQYTVSSASIVTGRWQLLTITRSGSSVRTYVNGQDITSSAGTHVNPASTTSALTLGTYAPSPLGYPFAGLLDEVQVSDIARTPDEIRQSYEVGLRTHPIQIDFGASLVSGNLITGSGDTSFNIDATVYGLDELGSELYVGEKVIVKENYDGTEYIAQGTVSTITESTGAVTVSSWDSGSTFPSAGYTVNADVFKWQREYIPIKNRTVSTHVDAVSLLTLRITDGNEGRNIWVDDLRSTSGYFSDYTGEDLTFPSSGQYFQYKAIFNTWDSAVTPYISQVQLVYGEGDESPAMDQIMRHGKWFNSSGVKQPFWWVNTP